MPAACSIAPKQAAPAGLDASIYKEQSIFILGTFTFLYIFIHFIEINLAVTL